MGFLRLCPTYIRIAPLLVKIFHNSSSASILTLSRAILYFFTSTLMITHNTEEEKDRGTAKFSGGENSSNRASECEEPTPSGTIGESGLCSPAPSSWSAKGRGEIRCTQAPGVVCRSSINASRRESGVCESEAQQRQHSSARADDPSC